MILKKSLLKPKTNKKYTSGDLFKYSLKLGIKYLKSFDGTFLKEGVKRLIIPMDIPRYFELPEVINELSTEKGEKILDLSSPKLLSLFISQNLSCDVYAVDIYKKEIDNWDSLTQKIDPNKSFFKNLRLAVADGRKLPYKNDYFDKIFSISAIEHISDNGDRETMLELARVLKPGGMLILTVPFGQNYEELFKKENVYGNKYNGKESIFFHRVYNENKLEERIIKPSGLKPIKKTTCGEKYPWISVIFNKLLPFSVILGLTFPILAWISLKKNPKKNLKNSNILLKMKKLK